MSGGDSSAKKIDNSNHVAEEKKAPKLKMIKGEVFRQTRFKNENGQLKLE